MQAMEVEEHFHIQHAYATPRELSYFKRNLAVSRRRTPLKNKHWKLGQVLCVARVFAHVCVSQDKAYFLMKFKYIRFSNTDRQADRQTD